MDDGFMASIDEVKAGNRHVGPGRHRSGQGRGEVEQVWADGTRGKVSVWMTEGGICRGPSKVPGLFPP